MTQNELYVLFPVGYLGFTVIADIIFHLPVGGAWLLSSNLKPKVHIKINIFTKQKL